MSEPSEIWNCFFCMHRIVIRGETGYCKAYQIDIELINTQKCKRFKKK